MICLFCEARLPDDQPQTCSCRFEHRLRLPLVGINHVSQLLSALDGLLEEEIPLEDVEQAVAVFSDLFDRFERKWRQRGPLVAELPPLFADRFAVSLQGIEAALQQGEKALGLLQPVDQLDAARVEQASTALLAFFHGVCAHAAKALHDFAELKREAASSGALIDLRSP